MPILYLLLRDLNLRTSFQEASPQGDADWENSPVDCSIMSGQASDRRYKEFEPANFKALPESVGNDGEWAVILSLLLSLLLH